MFQYLNHRFCLETVSFQIPNGYFFDSEPGEESDDFMRIWSPSRDFSVWIYATKNCDNTKEALMDVLDDIEPHYQSSIEELSINGLYGHQATYYMSSPQYYEAWLQLTSDTALTIIIESDIDIATIDVSTVLSEIDVRKEPSC